MKKVFSAPSVIPCDFLKSILESNGIDSMIKNEQGSGPTGYGLPIASYPSLDWAWPEVWVRDEDFVVASEIVANFRRKDNEDNHPDTHQGWSSS